MWTIAAVAPDQSIAVSVVPMLPTAGSASTIARRFCLALVTAAAAASTRSDSGIGLLSRGATVLITEALATSPASYPPMPSATASRWGPA